MPVSGAVAKSDAIGERKKQELLEKIRQSQEKHRQNQHVLLNNGDTGFDSEEEVEIRKNTIEQYKNMIDQTMELALEKLIMTDEGCDIFDELCLRLDINQKYVDILPQWSHLAHKLEMDALQTRWVETCVRPKEGLTRAILEIYMRDGGTLGDVLDALLQLECMEIIECIR